MPYTTTTALLAGTPAIEARNDFLSAGSLGSFTKTQIAAGDAALQAGRGGWCRFSGAATTNNSGAQIQGPAAWDLESKDVWSAFAKIIGNHADIQWLMGWALTGATLIGGPPTDGVWLIKTAASAAVSLVVRRGGVSVTTALGNIAKTGTFQTWGIQIRAKSNQRNAKIVVYLDSAIIAEVDSVAMPDDQILCQSFAAQSGSAAGTQTLDVDFLDHIGTRL